MQWGGGSKIELIEPLNSNSPINITLEKSKNSAVPYHICYEVSDINAAITELKNNGYIVTKQPAEAIAFKNRKVAFLFNSNVGLIEILEKNK